MVQRVDRLEAVFDDERVVVNANVIVSAEARIDASSG